MEAKVWNDPYMEQVKARNRATEKITAAVRILLNCDDTELKHKAANDICSIIADVKEWKVSEEK